MTQTDSGVNNDPTISLDELKRMSAARVNRPTGEARAAAPMDLEKMDDSRRGGSIQQFRDAHPIVSRGVDAAETAFEAAGAGKLASLPRIAAKVGPQVAQFGAKLAEHPIANSLIGGGAGMAGGTVKQMGGNEAEAFAAEMIAPSGIAKIGKKAYQGALGAMSEEAERLLPIARNTFGFDIKPGQARMAAPEAKIMKEGNQTKANFAASTTTGMPTKAMDSQWFKITNQQFKQVFEQVYNKNNQFSVDVVGAQKLSDLLSEIEPLAPLGGLTKVRTSLHKTLAGSAPNSPININGEELKFIRDELNKVRMTNTPASWKAGEAIDVIDEGVRASDPHIGAMLDRVRPQYRAWKTLDHLRAQGGLDANGNLSPQKLGEFLKSQDPKYRRDESTNQLAELGEVGELFGLKAIWEKDQTNPLVGAAKKMVPYAKMGALAGGAGFLGGVDPYTAAVVGAASKYVGKKALEGKAGQKVQESAGKYFRENPEKTGAQIGAGATGLYEYGGEKKND